MKLFKNDVGRPSNETLRKRKMLITVFVLLGVFIVGGLVYGISIIFANDLSSKSKNAQVRQPSYVGKQYYANLSTKRRDHSYTYLACPNGYVFDANLNCKTKYVSYYTTYSSKTSFNSSTEATRLCRNYGYTRATNVKLTYPSRTTKKLTFTCSMSKVNGEVEGYYAPYYNQNEVASTIMSACNSSKTLRNGGCLPSSIAMTFSALGKSYTPQSVNNYAKSICRGSSCVSGGYQICSSGSFYVQLANKLANYRGLRVYDIGSSSNLDAKLKTGKCVGIAALRKGCSGSYCYNTGHFVAVFASDVSGRVYVSDPWDRNKMIVSESASNIIRYTQANEVKVVCR